MCVLPIYLLRCTFRCVQKHYKFMLDLSFISKGKEKNGAEKYLPLIFADEYSKHTLSDAPLVSMPRKKLKQLQP